MEYTNELQKMQRWGRVLDKVALVIGRVMQVVLALSALVVEAFSVFGFTSVDGGEYSYSLTWFGNPVEFDNLSPFLMGLMIVLIVIICILSIFMVEDLMKALRSVFQAMANGRPFEEKSVAGFRRAAIWMLVIGILAGSFSSLVAAACLLVLSYVFRYGLLLQTESDETL